MKVKKKKKKIADKLLDKQLKIDACYITFSIYFLCSQDVSSLLWKEGEKKEQKPNNNKKQNTVYKNLPPVFSVLFSGGWNLHEAEKDGHVIPDILFVCKQSTSSVLVPCVSSVQKYKYMLSLHFFSIFLFSFCSHI